MFGEAKERWHGGDPGARRHPLSRSAVPGRADGCIPALLTDKTHGLHPDVESDRARLQELRDGRVAGWRDLSTRTLEDAGQHEFLNWISLAGAMHELGQRAEIVDYVESYVFNSDKCFAIFRPRG